MSNPASDCDDRFAEDLFLFLAGICQVLRFLCNVVFYMFSSFHYYIGLSNSKV